MDGVLTTTPQLPRHSQHARDGSCRRANGACVGMLRIPHTLCNNVQDSTIVILRCHVVLTDKYIYACLICNCDLQGLQTKPVWFFKV